LRSSLSDIITARQGAGQGTEMSTEIPHRPISFGMVLYGRATVHQG